MIARRRLLVTLAASGLAAGVWPFLALAQSTDKLPRIGLLIWWPEDVQMKTDMTEAFREVGYVDGRTAILDFRWAAGSVERAGALAAELARIPVDVLVVRATPTIKPAQEATRTIPIVTMSADPVGVGIIATLARRPGGNLTGVSSNSVALSAKRLELVRAILPRATRVTYLASSVDPQGQRFVEQTRADAPKLGLQFEAIFVRGVKELDGAFATILKSRPDALIVQPLFGNDEIARPRVVDFTSRHRVPSISDHAIYAERGGLLAYGADSRALYRQLVMQVDKILKGAKPSDLPVEEAKTFSLIVNLRTAKAIGLTVPPSVLLRADRVIE
jgi:putative ABC transport system substrate-binding protein